MRKLFLLCSPFFIVFLFLFSLSFYSGCARRGEEEITGTPAPTKTLLEFKLTVSGAISNFDGSYVVALDTDGDFSNGPYITVSDTTIRFSNFQMGFRYESGQFKKFQYNSQIDLIEDVPFSTITSNISGNTLTALWDPKDFGSPSKIDVNVFTWKQTDNKITIIDGLGDPLTDRDAKAIHMDLNNETEKSATDAADDVAQENASFNITSLSVKKITF